MFKKLISIFCIPMLILTLFVSMPAFAADSTSKSKTNENVNLGGQFKSMDELNTYYKDNAVPKDKQKLLTQKLNDGIAWDCYDSEKAKDIPAEFNAFKSGNEQAEVRYYRFEDGSFIKIGSEFIGKRLKVDTIKGTVTQNGIISGTVTQYGIISGTGYTYYYDYKIWKMVGACSAWFYADFEVINGGPSDIINIYAPGVAGFGPTGNPSSEIVRAKEDTNLSRAALARSYWFNQVTVSGAWKGISGSIPIGSTCELWLAVVNSNYYVDSKLPY